MSIPSLILFEFSATYRERGSEVHRELPKAYREKSEAYREHSQAHQ